MTPFVVLAASLNKVMQTRTLKLESSQGQSYSRISRHWRNCTAAYLESDKPCCFSHHMWCRGN